MKPILTSLTTFALFVLVTGAGASLPVAPQDVQAGLECRGIQALADDGSQLAMTCVNKGCDDPCTHGSSVLSPGHVLYWCECADSGETPCCHTQQRKIEGEWQEPEGFGSCAGGTNAGCPPGTCEGNPDDGWACQQ
jgi:hypothetical protein